MYYNTADQQVWQQHDTHLEVVPTFTAVLKSSLTGEVFTLTLTSPELTELLDDGFTILEIL